MPRVRIKAKTYKTNDLSIFIRNKCFQNGIKQCELAEMIGITKQAFSNRISKGLFTYTEMLVIVDALNVTDDELLSLMRLGRNTKC